MSENEKDPTEMLSEMLSSGAGTELIIKEDTEEITVYISPEDTEDIKDMKKSVEFTINSVRQGVNYLFQFGKDSGNPRYFEAAARLLEIMNQSTKNLMDIKVKFIAESTELNKPVAGAKIQNQNNYYMTNEDMLNSTIDVTPDEEGK